MFQTIQKEMYSAFNEGKSVAAEIIIRTQKSKIYKDTTAASKIVYFDALDDIVDEYNNSFNKTIKMKPIDVKSDSYSKYNEDSNCCKW